ncbi:hypothetical protein K7432_008215 [Basidiobolus ranarum]|uniref:CN hydrolase domain-containing protein n=1 Tax=Basidiobolus ranarum TaxID=34480 RepID=A0ABR2WSF2_9FUNG
MRIACCQFNPILGAPERNRERVDALLEKYQQGDFDFLILPEMAFSGYVFEGKHDIRPYLEDTTSGPTVLWAQKQALRLKCYVLVGYPEINKGVETKWYNSSCLLNPSGELVNTYRKTFLYDTDLTWSEKGPSFCTIDLEGFGKVGIGICMDLNYSEPTKYFDQEFATFHLNENTDLVIVLMAWILSNPEDRDPQEPSWSNVNYWAARLSNLFHTPRQHPTYFVACNRVGTEQGTTFCGSSCGLKLDYPQPKIIDILNKSEENILLLDLPNLDRK